MISVSPDGVARALTDVTYEGAERVCEPLRY